MGDLRRLFQQGTGSECKTVCACPQNNAAYELLFSGEVARAMQRFQQILAERPRDPEALAGLSICVAETRGRYVSATKLARESVRLAPRSPSGYIALAYIHLLGSKLEAGYRYLLKAEKLAPQDPRIVQGRTLFVRDRAPARKEPVPDHLAGRCLTRLRRSMQTPFHRILAVTLLAEGLILTGNFLV